MTESQLSEMETELRVNGAIRSADDCRTCEAIGALCADHSCRRCRGDRKWHPVPHADCHDNCPCHATFTIGFDVCPECK